MFTLRTTETPSTHTNSFSNCSKSRIRCRYVFDVNPLRRLAMKMLKNVVFTSVLLVPMLLNAQQSNTRYGNQTYYANGTTSTQYGNQTNY